VSSARRLLLVAFASPLLVVVGCSDDGTSEPTAQSVAAAPAVTVTTATSATTAVPTAARTAPTTTAAPPVQPDGFDLAPAEVTLRSGDVCAVCLWVAETALQRQRGLMGVTDLGVADGMAFVYDDPTNGQFWMRDTPLPLSIAFFADDGRFVSAEDMQPCLTGPPNACLRYSAARPYVTAIEVPQGGLADLGIGPGSRLELFTGPGCDAAGP
jgi:uncharacterized membrane protein (UPF0127 family)